MTDDYITGREFTSWQRGESEFRAGINQKLDDLLGLVRTQNSRVSKAEAVAAVVERRLEAIESADGAIRQTVLSIQSNGCHQFHEHKRDLEVLEGAGVLPSTDGPVTPTFSLHALSRRQKTAAGIGVGALMVPALSDLFKLGRAVVEWMAQIR